MEFSKIKKELSKLMENQHLLRICKKMNKDTKSEIKKIDKGGGFHKIFEIKEIQKF